MKEKNMSRQKASIVDSPKDVDLYNETIEQLKSVNTQLKSPGEYVASRLECVSLDAIRRELKALLASCQSQTSELLRSLFSNASLYNEVIEETIDSIVPLKDTLEQSLNQLNGTRSTMKTIHRDVKLYMVRYAMVSYTKITLSTYMEASKHLNNVSEEIVDSFKVYCENDFPGRISDPVHKVEALVQHITRNANGANSLMTAENEDSNFVTSWSLLEFAPREISHMNGLLGKCVLYESTIGNYLDEYLALLHDADSELYKSHFSLLEDPMKSNVEKVLEIESMLDSTDIEQFKGQYEIEEVKNLGIKLQASLVELTDICAHAALKSLFKLYMERRKLASTEQPAEGDLERVNRDIQHYVRGLCSLIKGAEQLQCQDKQKRPFVATFSRVFVVPILNTCINMALKRDEKTVKPQSPQNEFANFKAFVDLAISHLLDPTWSLTMQLLQDVSNVSGNKKFQVVCVFDAIAVALLNHIEKNFSSIYFPIYMEQFMSNCKTYEYLLDRIELAAGSYSHYLRWRGSSVQTNLSKCFSVGVICDNFIEDTISMLQASICNKTEISGVLHNTKEKGFYAQPSKVLYEQVKVLFGHECFFYHLMPLYLRGLSEMFTLYISYIRELVSRTCDSTSSTEAEEAGNTSGSSITYAAYLLHDLEIIVNSLRTGTAHNLCITLQSEKESDHQSTCIGSSSKDGATGKLTAESSQLPLEKDARTALENEVNHKISRFSVGMHSIYDGEIVTIALTRIDYPVKAAFKRIMHIVLSDKLENSDPTSKAIQILQHLWLESFSTAGGKDPHVIDIDIKETEVSDIKKQLQFTKESFIKLYNFFNSIHEQLETIKYSLEDFIIHMLYTSASCSLQFLQSMPSKFRYTNKKGVDKPSNYVKYLVVPLTSFKEFTAPSLSKELRCKIMTQTISKLSAEYRSQVLKLMQNVENINHSLLNAKNQKLKEQGANYLIADVEMIKEQLQTDIAEYIEQCETRMEISYNRCQELRRLKSCLEEQQSN